MYSLYIQLFIEELLSGGNAYLASHPELGVPLGIFNDKHEPDYHSRVKNIKKLGKKGSRRSLSYAHLLNISHPLPSFDDAEDIRRLTDMNEKLMEKVKDLTSAQNQYNDSLKDGNSSWEDIKSNAEGAKNVVSLYGNMIREASVQMGSFVLNTRAQYDVAEKIAEQYKSVAFNLGLTSAQSKHMSENFKRATPFVERIGLEVQDLQEIYSKFVEQSGRFQVLTTTELENLAMMTKAFQLSEQDTGTMADRFQLMGVTIGRMSKGLEETFKESRALGLNSQKVISTLQQNFASMQRMSFADGVKGMSNMAKLAVEMRMDVAEMLGMAEKFYEPEAAIEAAAELQLMGGDIAAAFGDPFEIMYLARNKPEELAQKVADMTENMMIFNKETGEYELPPEARQQLTFMADKLQLSKDNLIDTAYQASKLKDVKEAFGGSEMFSDEEQSAIAQMAKFDKGTQQWTVATEEGEVSLGETGELRDAITAGLLAGPADKQAEGTAKLVDNSFTTNQLLQNIIAEFKAGIAVETDFYEVGERILNQATTQMSLGNKEIIAAMGVEITKAQTGGSGNAIFNAIYNKDNQKKLGDTLAKAVSTSQDYMVDLIKNGISGANAALITNLKALDENIKDLVSLFKASGPWRIPGDMFKGWTVPEGGKGDFLSRDDGTMFSFDSKDTVLGAKGGGPIDKLLGGGVGTMSDSNISISPISINGDLTVNVKTPTGSATGQIENNDLAEALLPHLKSLILNKLGHGDIFSGGKPATSTTFPDEF